MRAQLAVVYLFATLWKLHPDWLTGHIARGIFVSFEDQGVARGVPTAACVDAEKMIAGDALSRERASAWRVGARRTWDFATSPLELFDLLAVLPFWLELAVRLGLVAVRKDGATASLSALRLLRLTRVTRVFKLGKQAEAFRMFVRVIARSTPALRALAVFILLLMSLFGSLVYAAERGEWRCSGSHWSSSTSCVGTCFDGDGTPGSISSSSKSASSSSSSENSPYVGPVASTRAGGNPERRRPCVEVARTGECCDVE